LTTPQVKEKEGNRSSKVILNKKWEGGKYEGQWYTPHRNAEPPSIWGTTTKRKCAWSMEGIVAL